MGYPVEQTENNILLHNVPSEKCLKAFGTFSALAWGCNTYVVRHIFSHSGEKLRLIKRKEM